MLENKKILIQRFAAVQTLGWEVVELVGGTRLCMLVVREAEERGKPLVVVE